MIFLVYALGTVMITAFLIFAVEEMRKASLARIDDGNDEL